MKNLLFSVLLFAAFHGYGQTPQQDPPYQLRLRVAYKSEKEQPGLAAHLYKSLREVPNVVLVNENPDALLLVTEAEHAGQYGCTFVVLPTAMPDVKMYVEFAVAGVPKSDARSVNLLQKRVQGMRPIYYWGNTWTIINESPKAAIASAVKSFDVGFVEKQRRLDEDARQSLRDNPLPPVNPPPPVYDPTPQPWAAVPASTPVQLLGPDPFPSKR